MDFDTDGAWDPLRLEGPAIHAPAEVKDIPISKFRVEWLDISQPDNNIYPKNHIATTYEPGNEYLPGVYTVALLRYSTPNNLAVHHCQGATVGTIIGKVITKKMHHFLFLPYTEVCHWKGCGDHLLHCWAEFVRDGDITSEDSHERPGIPLCEALTQTYINGGAHTYVRVGRGWWISYNPVEDQYTPETTYADGRLTHQILGRDDDEEE